MRYSGGYKTIDGKKIYFDSDGIYRDIAGKDYVYATDPLNNKTYKVEPQLYLIRRSATAPIR